MFQTLQNTIRIGFTLVPEGPILVRAQTVGLDPGVADMEFQRTHRDGRSTVFLAGSGLKGVIRSHAERLLRSADLHACDPTVTKVQDNEATASCGVRRETEAGRRADPRRPHDGQCAACFTFGSLKLAGRFRVGDAYPGEGLVEETNLTEVRTGVGIDRRSQAARRGVLYDTEVVVRGGFRVQIQGESFSLWQAGLVFAALEDLGAGIVHVGGNKARGMGEVRIKDFVVDLRFLDRAEGKLTGARGETKYALPTKDELEAPPGGTEGRSGLFRTIHYDGEDALALSQALIAGPLRQRLLPRKP